MVSEAMTYQVVPVFDYSGGQFMPGLVAQLGVFLNPLDIAHHFIDDTPYADDIGYLRRKLDIGA